MSTSSSLDISIDELLERVAALEQSLEEMNESYFELHGVENLIHERGTWKDKVFALLSHANIPYYWIIDIIQVPREPHHVIVYFINNVVTHTAFLRLQRYLHIE